MGWGVGVRRGESGICVRLTPVCAHVRACAGAAESLHIDYIHTYIRQQTTYFSTHTATQQDPYWGLTKSVLVRSGQQFSSLDTKRHSPNTGALEQKKTTSN